MQFRFSKTEIKHFFTATIMLSVAFSILFAGMTIEFLFLLPLMFLVVLLSFVVHEISHKYFAQKFNYYAEFRANTRFLFLTIVLSVFGFIIAAPGAVYIKGNYDLTKQGIIALAGPASNILMAFISLILIFTLNLAQVSVLFYIYAINGILAFFNMLPAPIFDGFKILKWNKLVYAITGIIALAVYLPIFL